MSHVTTKSLMFVLATSVAQSCVTSGDKAVKLHEGPADAQPYAEVIDRDTRKASVIDDFEMRYTVTATYLSPEFRAAFGQRMQDLFLQSRVAFDDNRAQAGFFVSIFSPDGSKMELENADYWTIALGESLRPTLIKPLTDKLKWQPYFSYLHSWSKEYLVVFDYPATGGEGLVEKKPIDLIFANTDGKVRFNW